MKRSGWIVVVAGLLLMQGCASNEVEQRLDEKLAQETQIKHRDDLRAESKNLIDSAQGLTAGQKTELTQLRKATTAEMDKITNDSLRLRSILIKDIMSPNYNAKEVDLIKRRLQDVEDKRVDLMMDAADKANKIMGHEAEQNEKLIRDFVGMRS